MLKRSFVLTCSLVFVACSSDPDSGSSPTSPGAPTTGTTSGSRSCIVATEQRYQNKTLCACGSVGDGGDPNLKVTSSDACRPETLDRPALCFERAQGFCDCRAWVCQTRVRDGRCYCGVGSVQSSGTDEYTNGCSAPTTGVCCVEGTSCTCGTSKCGSSATQVPSCEDPTVLDGIAPKFEVGGSRRVPSCTP